MPTAQNGFSSPVAQHSPGSDQSEHSQNSIYRSPQIRKEVLRSKFLNAQALQSNVNTRTLENLQEIIDEVDTINQEGSLEEKVKDQGEILLDSEIMTISSHVLKKCTYSLSKNMNTYDPIDFAENVRSYLCRVPDTVAVGAEEPDWVLLGKDVMKFFMRTPHFSMILGTLRPIPKREIVRRKVERDARAPTKRPENVVVLEKVEDSVEQIIIEIKQIIKQYQKQHKAPLDFFTLVLHPTDFGKTIENILHVSFLIRDGHIKFIVDEDGIPHVLRTSSDEMKELKTSKSKRNIQNVVSLTMKQWKSLVEAYDIKKPMIDLNFKVQKSQK